MTQHKSNRLSATFIFLAALGISVFSVQGVAKESTLTLDAASLESVSLTVPVGPVDIFGIDTDEVKIVFDVKNSLYERFQVEKNVTKGEWVVNAKLQRGARGFFNFDTRPPLRTTIYLPEQLAITAQTSGGAIRIQDVVSDAQLSTSGGSVKGNHLGGSLDVRTSGGSIKFERVLGNAVVRTSGGSVKLGEVSGSVDARTSGGSVRVWQVQGEVDVSTSGGSIKLDNLQNRVTASTSGGFIKVNQVTGPISVSTSGGSIEANGVLAEFTARTSGGGIRLQEVLGPVSAETAGGDVRFKAQQALKGNIELKTKGGDVFFEVAEGIGADIEAQSQEGIESDFLIGGLREAKGELSGALFGGGPNVSLISGGSGWNDRGKVFIRQLN